MSTVRWPDLPDVLRKRLSDPDGPIAPTASTSELHDERVAARLGIALSVTFGLCFLTGIWSHLQQDPVSWLPLPSRPAGLYRWSQGVHVVAGIATIPVLVAKLWVVWPRFAAYPPFRTVRQAFERIALLPLVGGGLFLVGTGLANVTGWYPWSFDFRRAHFAASWVAIGGMLIHVAVVGAVSAQALRRRLAERDATDGRLSRRGFLGAVAVGAGAATVATAGQTVRPLRALSVLAPRDPGTLPVNRTAAAAGVEAVDLEAYRLVVEGAVRTPLSLTYEDLLAVATRAAALPITCVEGWSAGARWRGVAVRDLLRTAGAGADATVVVHSLEQSGAYAVSELGVAHTADADTLLATHLEGRPLTPDHGFPCRLIAPNRPGVLQTKWVTRLEVR